MAHKCRVFWLHWHWVIECPSCGSVGSRFGWRNAITKALSHIRVWME